MAFLLGFLRAGSLLASIWSALAGWRAERRGVEAQKSADAQKAMRVLEAERQAMAQSPITKDELVRSLFEGKF